MKERRKLHSICYYIKQMLCHVIKPGRRFLVWDSAININNININMLNWIYFCDINDELKPVIKALPVFDQHYRQKSDS